MKWLLFIGLGLMCFHDRTHHSIPDYLKGEFTDDYGIKYAISSSEWIQYPDFKLSISLIDTIEMCVIGFNPADTTYTKIDYMPFTDQGDFKWGFCYSAYDKKNIQGALKSESANRDTPKTGCNGFPFSRMKPIKSE